MAWIGREIKILAVLQDDLDTNVIHQVNTTGIILRREKNIAPDGSCKGSLRTLDLKKSAEPFSTIEITGFIRWTLFEKHWLAREKSSTKHSCISLYTIQRLEIILGKLRSRVSTRSQFAHQKNQNPAKNLPNRENHGLLWYTNRPRDNRVLLTCNFVRPGAEPENVHWSNGCLIIVEFDSSYSTTTFRIVLWRVCNRTNVTEGNF